MASLTLMPLLFNKAEVVLPMSKIKYNIAKILEQEGWIKSAELVKGGSKGAKITISIS